MTEAPAPDAPGSRAGPARDAPAGPAQLPALPTPGALSWRDWAPPLAPAQPGGLPEALAEAIAAAWWDTDPHGAAAQMWEAYAAQLPPTPTVAQVATGSQSVSYSPPLPGGDYGLALARAAWHRTFAGSLHSVPVAVGGRGG